MDPMRDPFFEDWMKGKLRVVLSEVSPERVSEGDVNRAFNAVRDLINRTSENLPLCTLVCEIAKESPAALLKLHDQLDALNQHITRLKQSADQAGMTDALAIASSDTVR